MLTNVNSQAVNDRMEHVKDPWNIHAGRAWQDQRLPRGTDGC